MLARVIGNQHLRRDSTSSNSTEGLTIDLKRHRFSLAVTIFRFKDCSMNNVPIWPDLANINQSKSVQHLRNSKSIDFAQKKMNRPNVSLGKTIELFWTH